MQTENVSSSTVKPRTPAENPHKLISWGRTWKLNTKRPQLSCHYKAPASQTLWTLPAELITVPECCPVMHDMNTILSCDLLIICLQFVFFHCVAWTRTHTTDPNTLSILSILLLSHHTNLIHSIHFAPLLLCNQQHCHSLFCIYLSESCSALLSLL